jgi:hypothetical protein
MPFKGLPWAADKIVARQVAEGEFAFLKRSAEPTRDTFAREAEYLYL